MRIGRRRGEDAPSLDLLVAGLGNPGREYEWTRHNVGWLVVDEVARRHGGSFRSKFSGRLAEVRLPGAGGAHDVRPGGTGSAGAASSPDDLRLALLKPETYMNESGRSIAAAARFFKVPAGELVVVHDDVDLDEARLQARLGGGLAGHNGLRSIAQTLGTQDFLRLRIGVGRPGRGDRRSLADYVLSPFEAETDVAEMLGRAADAVEALARESLDAAQRRFN